MAPTAMPSLIIEERALAESQHRRSQAPTRMIRFDTTRTELSPFQGLTSTMLMPPGRHKLERRSATDATATYPSESASQR